MSDIVVKCYLWSRKKYHSQGIGRVAHYILSAFTIVWHWEHVISTPYLSSLSALEMLEIDGLLYTTHVDCAVYDLGSYRPTLFHLKV